MTLKPSRRGGSRDRVCKGDAAVDVFNGRSYLLLVASVAPNWVVGWARYLNVLSRGQSTWMRQT